MLLTAIEGHSLASAELRNQLNLLYFSFGGIVLGPDLPRDDRNAQFFSADPPAPL